MKKTFLAFILTIVFCLPAFSGTKEGALKYFNAYTIAANNYDDDLIDYYSPNAIIKRVVVRPDGTKGTAVFTMKDYATQLKLGQKTAKMRNYKNYYTNRTVKVVPNGYKISCLRQPSGEKYKLDAYFIVSDKSGKWKIIEESMDTKVQIFNNYVKK